LHLIPYCQDLGIGRVNQLAMATTPATSKFWLCFRVYNDGLDPPASSFHTSFPQFPQLPGELRTQIWNQCLQPRVILVSCQTPDNFTEQDEELSRRPRCRMVPVLLHVNREARFMALSHYELALSWKVPSVLADMDLVTPAWSSEHGPKWSEPHVYFNFEHDALFLLGELEPSTAGGEFNSPMTYFLHREDTRRVRRVAVAFRGLRHGESGAQQIFGTLFHVVDRLRPADDRVLICVTERDEMTHALMGGEAPLVPSNGAGWVDYATRRRESRSRCREAGQQIAELVDDLSLYDMVDHNELVARYERQAAGAPSQEDNFIQKIWREWYNRSTYFTSSLAKIKFWLIREGDLVSHFSGIEEPEELKADSSEGPTQQNLGLPEVTI
jgi:hypothetical protein